MRAIRHLTIAALTTLVVLGTTTTTAHAQQDVIKDKRADVVQYDGTSDASGTILGAEESIATGIDATKARVKYTKKSLTISMYFADLTSKRLNTYAGVRVRGEKKWPSYWIYSYASRTKVQVLNRSQTKVLCTGTLKHKAGEDGTLTIKISRSCIKKAKQIKVQTGIYQFTDLDDEDATLYDESISSTKYRSTSPTKWLKAS